MILSLKLELLFTFQKAFVMWRDSTKDWQDVKWYWDQTL